MDRFLCLALPTWATDRVRRRLVRVHPSQAEAAIVLTHGARGGSGAAAVARCCERARAAGVQPGASLAQARGLLLRSALHVEPHDPAGDRVALAALARAAQRFSPRAAAAEDADGLALEIGGSLRLFGGERALVLAALDWLAGLGLRAQAGVASTLGAASALAQVAGARRPALLRAAPGAERAALAELPLAVLRLDTPFVEELRELGLERVADVLALPRSEIPARLGNHLLERLDQALGRRPETLARAAAPREFAVAREFQGALESRALLAELVRVLIDELVQRLAEHDRVCARLALRLWPSDAPAGAAPRVLERHTSRPGRDPRLLWALLEHELERAPIGFGVERVELCALDTTHARERQTDLADETPALAEVAPELAALVDVLCGRLGPRAAAAVQAREDLRPECTFLPRALHESAAAARLLTRPRPTRLFDPAPPIAVSVADGRPRLFVHAGRARRVVHCRGPERLRLPWWPSAPRSTALQPPPLGAPERAPITPWQQRDYFGVQDEEGRSWWLCRALVADAALLDVDARLAELEERAEPEARRRAADLALAWYLHGEWA
jgi:protein ImuB